MSKAGARKGGLALAALLTKKQRHERAVQAVRARWQRENAGRITQDQGRVMRKLAGRESAVLTVSDGPSGRRRRLSIGGLVLSGLIEAKALSRSRIRISARRDGGHVVVSPTKE
jgi:hypothetical protein